MVVEVLKRFCIAVVVPVEGDCPYIPTDGNFEANGVKVRLRDMGNRTP